MKVTYPLTIFYDASCPICEQEMQTLKQSDSDNRLVLLDCSDQSLAIPESCPVTRVAMMQRIHAIDANGVWFNGIDVFAAAYAASGHHIIARFWGSNLLKPILSSLYPLIADNRQWLSKTPLPYLYLNALRYFSRK